MKVNYRTLDNGLSAVVEAVDAGPGPHDVHIRSLPSGSFAGHPTWTGEDERTADSPQGPLVRFDGTWPESVGLSAYGHEITGEADIDGKACALNLPTGEVTAKKPEKAPAKKAK